MTDSELKELQALCNVDSGMDLMACIKQRIDKAESKLARVRGLLQRSLPTLQWAYEKSYDSPSSHQDVVCEQFDHLAEVRRALAAQGAESADIRKLGTADKKKVSEMCLDCMDWHGKGDCKKGSAETGGEKAAPEKSAEEWAINVRERYDPIGQEGFISLSMALFAKELDMYRNQSSSGSREPEKLNNAQQCLNRSAYDANRRCSKVSQHSGECTFPALAESSLSKTIDTTGENPSF